MSDSSHPIIGHLDTGIALDQCPSLKNSIKQFCLVDHEGKRTVEVPKDTGLHGTQTARCLIETFPEALLYSAAVIDKGHIYSRILSGLEWMLEQPIDVLSIAIGLKGKSPIFERMLKKLSDRGVLVVVPSGNQGTNESFTPAWSPHVLTVGALDEKGEPALFSSTINREQGECLKPEILAPGCFHEFKGTSFASSAVAAVSARLWQQSPHLTAKEIQQFLCSVAQPLPADLSYKSQYGFLSSHQLTHIRLPESANFPQLATFPAEETAQRLFVDPYLLRILDRPGEQPIHFLITWQEGLETDSLNRRISRTFKKVTTFLDGEIIHCVGSKAEIKNLLNHESIAILHATIAPLFS